MLPQVLIMSVKCIIHRMLFIFDPRKEINQSLHRLIKKQTRISITGLHLTKSIVKFNLATSIVIIFIIIIIIIRVLHEYMLMRMIVTPTFQMLEARNGANCSEKTQVNQRLNFEILSG